MTNGLTTVAGIPGGAGVASKPPVERGEAKKPEPAPAVDWQLGAVPMADYFKAIRDAGAAYAIPTLPWMQAEEEQLDAPALNNPHPLGEEKFLAWGWDAAKKVAEQTFKVVKTYTIPADALPDFHRFNIVYGGVTEAEQQEACLDWPALNYCDSCQTCAHCLKNGCLPEQK